MRQLDLFAAFDEQPVKKQDEGSAVPADVNASTANNAADESSEIKQISKTEQAANTNTASTLIFDDGRIAVKIKPKKQPVAEEIIVPVEVQEPVETIVVAAKRKGRKSLKEIEIEINNVDVPDDESLFSKQYYPISTVAKWFNVNTSLLRYWENEFDILKPRKNRKGDRLFRPEDIKNLQVIYYLLRQRKFTIEGAKEYLKANKKKADINLQLIQTLTKFKSFLLELRVNLEF